MYPWYLDVSEDGMEPVMQLMVSEEEGRGHDCSPALLPRWCSGVVVLLVAPELENNKEKCEQMRGLIVK